MRTRRVSIQEADFDAGAEMAELRRADGRIGAVCSFVGTVRGVDADDLSGSIRAMELEHYPGMTEKSIEAMIDTAQARFGLLGARVVHRVGKLAPGEQIVLVAVAAGHRAQAFQACEYLMDYLKTQAPFWKKEFTAHGERWVPARASDDAARDRWGSEPPAEPPGA